MKNILFLIFMCASILSFSQASSSSDFELRVSFDDDIQVENVKPYYIIKSGNAIRTIEYKIDSTSNALIFQGSNDYILWVSFPVLVFTLTADIELPSPVGVKKVERTFNFYLISQGPLSSYTGEQKDDIHFSYEKPTVVASLITHNHDNAFEKLEIKRTDKYSMPFDVTIGNEWIRIEQ